MTNSILDLIGNTPIVEIKNLNLNSRVKIFAKLEYLNPGGSIKDRAALFMIQDAEKKGLLTKDKIIIEATSGNTGIGLALICSIKGYKLKLAMPESASIERRIILKARGAEILLTPANLGTDGAIEEIYKLGRENPDTYFMTDQFNNEANWKAHYFTTAQEILKQTDYKVSKILATMGTTGTVMGIARRIKDFNKEHNRKIEVIGVEPYLGHKIQGLKNMKESYTPGLYDKSLLDKKINIEDEEAFEMTRRLAKTEGLFVGMSSGAAMAAALKESEDMQAGEIIVIIFPDGGERYLSTNLFTVKNKVNLNLFNTITHNKELFEANSTQKVCIYSSGPVVSKKLEIDQYRHFVFTDLLCRYFEFRGYLVNHAIGIIDYDDNTIAASEKENIEMSYLTKKYMDSFIKDLDILGIKSATKYLKASEYIDDMILIGEKLVQKGFAYEKLRSLYFDVSKFNNYGHLSRINLDKIKFGLTINNLDDYEKDNPRDFTLFKRAKLSEIKRGIYSNTKWGSVRASLHVQSIAMAMKYFGESLDIHTSPKEFLFPHNENEIAISYALINKNLAKYWLHCENLGFKNNNLDNLKNLTLENLINMGYSGREIRYLLISTHYKKPIYFSFEKLNLAKKSLEKLDNFVMNLSQIVSEIDNNKACKVHSELNQMLYDIKQDFISCIDNDLNISMAIAYVFRFVKKVNLLILEKKINANCASKILETLHNLNLVLNIFDFKESVSDTTLLDTDTKLLIEERRQARFKKDFKKADEIRDILAKKGIILRDQKS